MKLKKMKSFHPAVIPTAKKYKDLTTFCQTFNYNSHEMIIEES